MGHSVCPDVISGFSISKLNLLEKPRLALLFEALQHRSLPWHRYGYSWDIVVTPTGKLSTSLMYFTYILIFVSNSKLLFMRVGMKIHAKTEIDSFIFIRPCRQNH